MIEFIIYILGAPIAYKVIKFVFLKTTNLEWTVSDRKMGLLFSLGSWVMIILFPLLWFAMSDDNGSDKKANW